LGLPLSIGKDFLFLRAALLLGKVVLILLIGADQLLDFFHRPTLDIDMVNVLVMFQKCNKITGVKTALENVLSQVFLLFLYAIGFHCSKFLCFLE
jgi:hypothetical protein